MLTSVLRGVFDKVLPSDFKAVRPEPATGRMPARLTLRIGETGAVEGLNAAAGSLAYNNAASELKASSLGSFRLTLRAWPAQANKATTRATTRMIDQQSARETELEFSTHQK
mmetsp:Transcript_116659/g.218350  ORF Transcript_116659/g.218350 Transcript_116659/m.218350 type:complete len:112 (-) Transcript_116659:16-351(-)